MLDAFKKSLSGPSGLFTALKLIQAPTVSTPSGLSGFERQSGLAASAVDVTSSPFTSSLAGLYAALSQSTTKVSLTEETLKPLAQPVFAPSSLLG